MCGKSFTAYGTEFGKRCARFNDIPIQNTLTCSNRTHDSVTININHQTVPTNTEAPPPLWGRGVLPSATTPSPPQHSVSHLLQAEKSGNLDYENHV